MKRKLLPVFTLLVLVLSLILAATGCGTSPQPASGSQKTAEPREAPPRADFAAQGRILYIKDGVVFVWSNGSAKRLTDQRVAFDSPAWAPDGKRIAATIVGQNHSDLVILSGSGSLEKQVTRHASNVRVQDSSWARRPAWSSDGSKIAYASDAGADHFNLWTVNSDGSAARRLAIASPGYGDMDSPAWAPDEKKIAFVAHWEGVPQIYVFTLANNSLKKISSHKEGAYDPAWSRDGSWIAYTGRTEGKHDLWLTDPDGKSSSQMTSLGTARAPAWSPDGQLIAFVAYQDQLFDLFAVKVAQKAGGGSLVASDPKQLTRGERIDATSGISWNN